MSTTSLSTQVKIHKALGHSARLRVLAMLAGGELCVCQIIAVLGLAASTVSAHLADLKGAELIEEEKQGRWVRYRLTDSGRSTLTVILPQLGSDPQITHDAHLIATLRPIPLEDVCRPGFDLFHIATTSVKKGRKI